MAKRQIHKVTKASDRAACTCAICFRDWVYVATTEDYNPEKETPCLLDIYMSDCEHNAGKICITLSKTKPAKEKKAPVKRAPRAKKVKTQELPPEKDQ